MAEIKRIYRQSLPAMKFVGKCYSEKDKKDGAFAYLWAEWFENNLFAPLLIDDGGKEPFEDCNAYYGLMRIKEGEGVEYRIGVFMPPEAEVPEGYSSVDFDPGDIAVCWIYGKEPEIYFYDSLTAIGNEGYEWTPDKNGARWCFERYVSPRFTEPDKDGNVILDMCYYVK